MGKFKFSLESVRRYKEQNLNKVKQEYAEAENAVAEQKKHISALQEDYLEYKEALKIRTEKGLNVLEFNNFQNHLMKLQDNIEDEIINLGVLERKASLMKKNMLEAKIESASIETIRDKRLIEHNMTEKKVEEAFIEEFVSNKMFRP